MNIKVSDRVKEQQPLFIQEENEIFYTLLQEYYKSQEKTGRPYDIANNLLNYFDVNQYNSISLTESTTLLNNVGYYDDIIEVEDVTGFNEVDGSFLVDNEVFYYETVSKSPSIVLTPGISQSEFDSRYQVLESILPLLVPAGNPPAMGNTYPLRVAGIPVSPISNDHLIVSLYGKILKPGIDYNIDNTDIVLTDAPRPKTSDDGEGQTYIKYLLGFAQNTIQTLDEIVCVQNKKVYPALLNNSHYALKSEILCVVTLDDVLLTPYEDYVFTSNSEIQLIVQPSPSSKVLIRSIEYTAKEVGKGASAISEVVDGKLVNILVKNTGSGYQTNFVPKVTIDSQNGQNASAITLINGIKNLNLLSGGSGYTSTNPPLVTFTEPPAGGSIPVAQAIVDDATGSVTQVRVLNSGSGYLTPPKVKFVNPGGAKISRKALIDADGKIIPGSLEILHGGNGYSTPPLIYVDSPTAEGSNRAILQAVLTDGQVSGFIVLTRGNGYTFEPRVQIIDPVGAQILDVNVSNGSVINIELLTGGSGYIDPPSVYIVDNRRDINGIPYGGTGAKATATVFNGSITDINITAFGTGYSADEPPTVFIAPPPEARASSDIGIGEVTGFEILTQGDNYTPAAFIGVSRGVSNVINYDSNGEQIFTNEMKSRARQHTLGSKVVNLDSLFLLQIFNRFVDQYLPDFSVDYTKVNASQVVKSIKDFYLSKGTKNALEYLFKILYAQDIDISYPKDEVFKPSNATWAVDTILRATLISGDPGNLVNSVIYQYEDDVDQNVKFASALVENVISIYVGNSQIYEISISEETKVGSFIIPYKTRLVEALTETSNIITVDSTLGWPERNGTVILGTIEEGQEYVQYKEKTLNQFLECTRSKNGVIEDWDSGTLVGSDILLYANKGLENEVIIKVVGIAEASSTVLSNSGSYYLPGDKLSVAKLGATTEEERVTSWLYNVKKLVNIESITPGGLNNKTATVVCTNPHGLLVGDQVTVYGANPIVYNGSFIVSSRISDTVFSYEIPQSAELAPQGNILISVDLNKGKSDDFQINNLISKYTSNIQNTFFNDKYAYVASTGIPNYKIGPFLESALIPGNQRKLNRFPLKPNTTSVRFPITTGPIATFVNGVSAWSYKSPSYVTYGGVTGVDILIAGENYDAANPPILSFIGGGGSGAKATVSVNGSIYSFEVTDGGSGYADQPLVSIVGGGGSGATARAIVTNGVVTQILVENPGEGYTSEPIISISGGGGYGALAVANVRGPISKVNLISQGQDYTSVPTAVLSSGEKAEAQPIIINGRVVSIAVISAGEGYTTAPNVYINGDGFGAKAKAIIGTIGEDKGKVIGIQIINRGIGYSQGQTTIRLESIGQGAVFKTNVFNWQYDLDRELNQNYDSAKGYVFAGYNTQYGGEYAHVSNPQTLRYVLGDNVFKNEQQVIQENDGTFLHSPIIGWAFDGNPIYGPYGYTDATDSSKGVRRMRTSYKLKSNVVYNIDTNPEPSRIDGPPLAFYPAGTFIQDYEYSFGFGDLDEYNGRFCKTPEYPNGTYAYFTTIDASAAGNPVFPYLIGPYYYSAVDTWNLSQDAVQINIPTDVVRYRDPYEEVDIDTDRQPNARTDFITTEAGEYIIFEVQDSNNDGLITTDEEQESLELTEEQALEIFDYFPKVDIESKVDIEVETTTKFESAQIDGFVIENPGVNYKVNDKITFNNEGTDGFGASAKVESVVGSKILNYSTTFDGENTIATITTEDDHGLVIGDTVIIDTEPALDTNYKNFKVKTVAGLEDVVVLQEGIGYNVDIPPEYELITQSGQDAVIDLVLNQGKISKVDIINSGNGYDVDDVPQIRVTHPQIFKKANYFATEFDVNGGRVEWFDSYVTEDRSIYLCGRLIQTVDKVAILAKFNNDGRLIWKRTLTPLYPSAGAKDAVWKRLVVVDTNPHTIYVIGETVQNTVNITYNPDILIAKYVSGFNAQNQADGIIQWQKELSGISGATRRDYASAIAWSTELDALVLGGYTDTNTASGNDMWFMLMNELGDVVEKRKVTTDSEQEKLTDIFTYGPHIYWTGIIGSEDIIYGRLSYDNVDLNFDWGKRIPNPVNYKFVDARLKIDSYESIYLYATETNNSTSAKEKVTLFRIDLEKYDEVVWAKRLSPAATSFTSIEGIGVHVDVFNNINIGVNVVTSSNRFVDIVKFKHDGTILNDSRILVNTTWEGKTISMDSSADVFVSGWTTSDIDIPTYSAGATISTAQSQFGSSSLLLNGTTGYASLPSNDKFGVGTGDFTIDLWVRPTTTISDDRVLLDLRSSVGSDIAPVIWLDNGVINYFANGSNRITGSALTVDTWYHVAISRLSGTTRMYVNGVRTGTDYFDSNDYGTTKPVVIGAAFDNSLPFPGYIDEVRLSKGVARYSGNTINIPSTSFDRDVNTSLLLHFNQSTQYDISTITKLDNKHTKLGSYTFSTLNNIETLTISDVTYSIDEDYSPQISTFSVGSAGYQLLDFADAVSAHLPGNYTFNDSTQAFTSRTATVPTPSGKTLRLKANVVKKFYLRDSLVVKADVVKKITFNQNARFIVGKQLQWYTIQGTGENTTEIVSAYGSIIEVGDNYASIGKIYGNINTTSRIKDSEGTINEYQYTFLDVPYTGTLGTFTIPLSNYTSDIASGSAEFKDFSADDYVLKIVSTIPGSSFLPGDIVPIGYNGVNISFDSNYQTLTVTGLTAVDKITLVTNLRKIVKATVIENTNELYIVANSAHNYNVNDIIYVEGFLYNVFNGSFFINRIINNREYVYGLREIPSVDPVTSTSISAVQVHAKHPSLVFVRGHQYIFDVGDSSNAGYYLSFSKDNQYKLEYSFNNITRNGNAGIDPPGVIPYVRFKTVGDVTNISYYFDPSHIGADSPVGVNSFIDVVDTPYKGRFRITSTPTGKQFKFKLEREPEGPVILDTTSYSTTSTKAAGPINSIKLVNKGGFYKKLPIITNIASERQIDRIVITSGGTEYSVGVYRDVPILGDGEGGKVNITVELGGDPVTGTITDVDLIDPGKGYTTGYIDVDSIPGILGPSLSGAGAQLDVVIPPQGTGASVFLQGTQIGKIKKLKNNNFGYDYPHDYTLKPEITFPTILQLFNTSVLTSIKVTDPGAGYTSAPAVLIEGGGGVGAQAVAIVRNNRLQEIIVKDPGSGYSSEPTISLKSEFVYVVNVDLGYFQFNFPHGITTGAEVTLRADSVGSTQGILPQPSSAGLTSLVQGQIYYAIAGNANGLEDNQLRIALTLQDAQNGQFITFLNNGDGKQILLTEVFGGKAKAIVETSRFLQGEKVYQGNDLDNPSAVGYVSTNDGWQIGPRLLKVVDYTGDWKSGEKVTGIISKASGTIDNINAAVGTLNIGSVTQTPGKFLDNVGKPSEIVQKIQDSYFYQDFAYVVKSEIPINQWRDTVRKVNHPAGFNLFGQLNLTGGKDLSGRKVATDFTKRVDISEFTNFADIVNFAAAQPIYSEFNNSEVIFRNKRLTSSEEILTSVVKKIDDISGLFDGEKTSFPLKIQGEQVIASTGQTMILINGIVQSPVQSYTIANGNIEFTEAPKPPASVVYREIEFEPVQVKRISISNISGILPEINNQIRGITTNASATVIKSTTSYIDVINVSGSFQVNETIVSSQTGLNATVVAIDVVIQDTIFQFGEQITNLDKKIAIIEEINLASSLPKYPTQVSAWNNLTAQTAHRFSDGADLIAANRQYIIEQSFNDMQTEYPSFEVPGGAGANDKCRRDIGYIVDAVIADIRGGGNSNIIEATRAYFFNGQPISNGLVGEEVESIFAFNRAKYYMQQAVVNQLPVKDVDILPDLVPATNGGAGSTNTNLNPNNCSDVKSAINTLVTLLTNALSIGSIASLPTSNPGVWNIGSATNKLVISKTYGTSKYETGLFELELLDYFISAETGIVGKITKINPYRDPQTNQVVGTLNINTGSTFFGLLFERLPLPQNPNTIVDDISKTIIGASKVDNYALFSNQNFPLSEYAQNINLVYNNATGTWTAGDYIRNTKISYVNAAPPEDHRGYDSKKLIQLNKAAIIAQVIDDIAEEYPDFDFPGNSTLKCERDLGYIIDAVCNDIVSNGNANIVIATKRYFDSNGSVVYLNGEEEQSIFAFEKARDYMKQAVTNTLTIPGAQQDLSIIADSATGSNTDPNSCANIRSQIDTLTSILTTCLTDGDLDSLSGVSITDGAFTVGETIRSRKIIYKNKTTGTFFPEYTIRGLSSNAKANILGVNSANSYLYIEPPTGTFQSGERLVNLDITNTGSPKVRLVSRPEFRFLDAADRIKANIDLIKEETIGYIARKYPDFYYPKSPSTSYRYKDASNLIRGNIDYIVSTAYNAIATQYPTFTNPNPTKCRRDLRYVVLAIAQDLYDGGNKWTRMATEYYFNNGVPISNGLVGEEAQSVYAFNQARDLCKLAVTNQLTYKDLTLIADPNPSSGTVSNINPNSCSGVRNTIDTLFSVLTTSITSGSISNLPTLNQGDFSPGEFTCKRDLGYILDGFIFDLQYGGNSATVNNGDFYIDGNGNVQFIKGEESETRAAFKYARDYAIAAMRNFTVTLSATRFIGSTPTLTVASTVGIVEGMTVTGTDITSDTFVVEVLNDTQVKLNQNPTSNATADVTFTLNYAKYTILTPNTDPTLTIDTNNPSCANVASAITTLWQTLDDIIATQVIPEPTLPTYTNKFGNACASFGVSNTGTNNIKINNPERLELGTNDFTIEMWVYRTTIGTSQVILDMKSSASAEVVPTISFNSLNQVTYAANGLTRITSNDTIGANTWTHLAVIRNNLTTKMYINGVSQTQTFNDTLNYVGSALRIGSSYQDNNGFRGLMDEFRMSVTARYTADFTPPSEEYEYDPGDIVLFHFNGDNGTTDIYPEDYVEATYDSLRTSVSVIGQIDPLEKVLTVETIDGSREEYRSAASYIRKNRELIIDEMIGRLKMKYPSLIIPGDDAGGSDGTNICARDSAYIIDAIINDLLSGGNYNTVYTAKFYLEKSGALRFISGELLQSVYAYQEIGNIINSILTNTLTIEHSSIINVPVQSAFGANVINEVTLLCDTIADILAPTGNRFRDAGNLLYFNRKYIAEEVADGIEAFFKWTYTATGIVYDVFENPNREKCIRDMQEYIIPAMITDLLTGGNNATIEAFKYYIDSNTNIIYVEDELLAMYKALELAKPIAQKAVNNLLYAKNSINTPTGAYIASFTNTQPYRDLTILPDGASNQNQFGCANVTSAISTLFDLMLNIISEESSQYSSINRRNAAKLLLFNKSYIANEAFNETKAAYPLYPGTVNFGYDILNDMIYDLVTNGNAKTYARALSWLDAFYNFIAFSGYNPVHIKYHLDRIKSWANKAITQTLNALGPTTNQPRYSELGLTIGTTSSYVDTLIELYKTIITTPSEIENETRDPGVKIPSITYAVRTIPVPYSISMEPSSFIYGETSTTHAEVSQIVYNKYQIREIYQRFTIELDPEDPNPAKFVESEVISTDAGDTATVYQTNGSTYIDVISQSGTFGIGEVVTGDDSTAVGTITAIDNRLMLKSMMGEFATGENIYSESTAVSAVITQWNYNSGAILDNTVGKLTLDTETVSGSFNRSDLIYSSESEYTLTCFDPVGFRSPRIGEYIKGSTVTSIQVNTSAITTSGGNNDRFVQGDRLDVIANNLPTGQYATIISYDEETGIMYVGNKTSNFDAFAQVGSNTIGVYQLGTLQPKIFTQAIQVTTTTSNPSGRITRIDQSGTFYKIWLTEVEGSFLQNQQITASEGFKLITLTTDQVVARANRYSRGFDGSLTSFKLTYDGTAYFPDPDGHLLVFVNGILQPPGADYAYTVFADNIQFTEAPAAGSSFHAYYVGKLRLLDDISFDFDSLRSSFNLKLAGTFYSLTITQGVQSSIILPENNIIVAVNGVLQEPGVGFKLVGSRITFSEIPRAGSSFIAFSYVGSDADVVSATVVPPIEIGDELFIDGEETNRTVAVIESSNSLVTYEYSGSVKGRNGSAVAEIKSGRLNSALVTAPGSGYTSRPTVDILSPTGFDGQIIARVGVYRVDVSDGGSGYVYPTVEVDNLVPDLPSGFSPQLDSDQAKLDNTQVTWDET
jgi:hypothetical protein